MSEDIEILSSLDQPIPYNTQEIEDEIDRIISEAIYTKDVSLVLSKGESLIGNFRASGLGLAKLLYEAHKNWDQFDAGDNFYDLVFDRIGISTTTIDRYITVWSMYDHNLVPVDLQGRLKAFPLKNQIPIAKAIEQGVEFSEAQWMNLSTAPDNSTILAEIRTAKGQPPRKNAMLIKLRRNGNLELYVDGQYKQLGWLNLDDAKNDLDIDRAISRILSGAGIMRE